MRRRKHHDERSDKPSFVVVIDTREQRPFTFRRVPNDRGEKINADIMHAGLKTGDYSILGFEDKVAVERKTMVDIYQTVSRGRSRFQSELTRLREIESPAIVLECDLKSLLKPPPHTKVSPFSVLGSLVAWSVRNRIPVWPCPGRRFAEILTYKLLWHFWTRWQREEKSGRHQERERSDAG